MKILFVTPPPSLPSRLHRVRAFDLIRLLVKKHKVYLLAVTTKGSIPEDFKEIEKLCQKITVVTYSLEQALLHSALNPRLPFEVSYCFNDRVTRAIKNIIATEAIDLVYLKRLRSAIWLKPSIAVPVIVDTTDAMSMFYKRAADAGDWWQKPFFWHEKIAYQVFERRIFQSIKNWIVSANPDRNFLKKRAPRDVNFFTVPNPVDTQYFYPQKTKEIPQSILFRGLMDKLVNIDASIYFVKEILPLIRQKIPTVHLTITGPNPATKIRQLDDRKNIIVTGYVEDMVKTIARHQIIVCPVRIVSGTRHKILQAWSMKKAVVSTFRGADGLHTRQGENILLADSPTQFASSAVELLMNKRRRVEMGWAGRKTVEQFYSFQAVGRILNRVVEDVYTSCT